jgi:hypothetical protein
VRLSKRFLTGGLVVLIVLVSIAVIAMMTRGENSALPAGAQAVTLNCIGGDEKASLMADEQVKRILLDKYGLAVNYQPMGSYNQVQLTTDVLKQRATACLWPASASAQAVFEAQHRDAFENYRAETVLQSPEVIYAGPQSAEALVKAGIARREGTHFAIDMKSLVDHVLRGQTWESLQAGNLAGPVTVSSTDPAKSNSGFALYQLMLSIASTSNVYQAPSPQQARAALPAIRRVYDAQGLLSRGSGAGFKQWRLQGGESHAPLYAGYENQLIEVWRESAPADHTDLLDRVRVLYPEPTLFNDHPILALTADGGRLVEAMKDPEIQKIAWVGYGFRSGVDASFSNVADLAELPLASQFRTTAPPNADVTLLLLNCLLKAENCA